MGSSGIDVKAAADRSPFDKLIGVVENRKQLRKVSQALKLLGIQRFQVLEGPTGIVKLDAWTVATSHCFLGDMEAEMVSRFQEAARNGYIVFASVVESESVAQAAETVKQIGATEIVHFGTAAITNY